MGLTSAPATDAIMGVVPKAKAGVGSAVNDATRLLGGTLGVAVIGSVFASLYASRLTTALPIGLPSTVARTAHESVGAALSAAGRLGSTGHPALASAVHDAANAAFFHGFHTANYLAAAVAAAGAVMALSLLPAHPSASGADTADVRALGSPATAAARG
jgi:Xaa-Pro aminopeptidase